MPIADHFLDLGKGYSTRLSLVAAVVPVRWVDLSNPFPVEPVMYMHLKGGLGVLPVYTDAEEVADFFDTEVPHLLIRLADDAWVARDELVAVMPPMNFEEAMLKRAERDSGFRPGCFVRVVTNAMILPCDRPVEEMTVELRRAIGGFFGDD